VPHNDFIDLFALILCVCVCVCQYKEENSTLIGAFQKMREATLSFVMSVC